jgi:uncharacterized protein (DUF305 family)
MLRRLHCPSASLRPVLMTRKSCSGVAVACALALAGCGSDNSSDTGRTQPPPPGNGADRAYVNAMIPLHEKAVAIAVVGQRRGKTFVKRIAQQVAGTQPPETARLRAIGSALFSAAVPIGSLGIAPTDAADVDLARLRKARPFDPAFLRAMIAIHQATIALCKAEIAKGDQVDLKTTAQAIVDAEAPQLASMKKRLKA